MSRTIQGSSTVGIKLTLASDNPVTVVPTGSIDSAGLYAIYGSDAVAWSLINRGKLSGGHSGVTFAGSGTITNGSASAPHASISGSDDGIIITGAAATVINNGTITGKSAASVGVYLAHGGRVTNAASGVTAASISGGRYGVEIAGGPGTIVNRGTIKGGAHTILVKGAQGTVVNYGRIRGSTSASVALYQGGSVTNNSTGTIFGNELGISVGGSASSTVANFGLISSAHGIAMSAKGGTAINAGTIDGTQGVAVFTGDRMILRPGGAFLGKVFANVLELAGGSAPGTVKWLGSRYLDVATQGTNTVPTIVVDAGAQWTLAGDNTLTSGATLTTKGTLTNAGTLRGSGVMLLDHGTVTNAGKISSLTQVTLNSGSYLLNQQSGSIYGGVTEAAGTSKLTNLGLIHAQLHVQDLVVVSLTSGGTVTNGSITDTMAAISGGEYGVRITGGVGAVVNHGMINGGRGGIKVNDAAGSVVNSGTIGGYWEGVQFYHGGSVTNTSSGVILGRGVAVDLSGSFAGTIINSGTIGDHARLNPFTIGARLRSGGSVTNTNSGVILGRWVAVDFSGSAAGTIINAGTIGDDTQRQQGIAVRLGSGGSVTNTNSGVIHGRGVAVDLLGSSADTIINLGTIVDIVDVNSQRGRATVFLGPGGEVTNGSEADHTALISSGSGGSGILCNSGIASVANFGTVVGGDFGIEFNLAAGGGSIINGSETDDTALIQGDFGGISNEFAFGVGPGQAVTVTNFGTIEGIRLHSFGSIVNGSATDTKALIEDVSITTGTVVNFGRIINSAKNTGGQVINIEGAIVNFGSIISSAGTTGSAIYLGELNGASVNRLVVGPGAVFVGKVRAGGSDNTLELAQGTSAGSIGGIGSQFTGFNTMTVDPGAKWMLTGSNNAGMVTIDGSLSIAAGGTLDITASVDPASNGQFQINANSLLEIAANTGAADQMKFLGAGTLTVDAAAQFGVQVGTTAYAGPLIESFMNGDKIDLKDVLLAGSVLDYASAAGLLQIPHGGANVATLAFETSSLGAGSFHATDDGTGHLLLTHSQ